MNALILVLTGVALGLLLALPVFILCYRRFTRRHVESLQYQEEIDRQAWEECIYDLNHHGPSPERASKKGLSRLVIMSLTNNIESLQKLLTVQDWDTRSVIEKLIETRDQEATMLFHKISNSLDSWRAVIKKYEHKQFRR